ncbi:MAG: protein phosphatase 2C domain-containing protein [Xylophilus ampelinus]
MDLGYRIHCATGLHRGDREYQQDQVALLVHPHVNGCLLGVLADGMGGRTGGRKASDQILMTARQLFEGYRPDRETPAALLRRLATESHIVIRLTAIAAEQEPHSTVAAFLALPDGSCHWMHVGDSRIYHFRDGRMVHRTRDHSYVQQLIDRGQISEDEAVRHPQSNVLMGCLGTQDDPPIALHRIDKLQPGDAVMACSDGLWHYFTPEEMAVVASELPPRDASEFLVAKARSRAHGGGDNLSLVLMKLSPPQPVRAVPAGVS